MGISFLVSLAAVMLALLSTKKNKSLGLEMSFVILTIFLSLRYGYGNDYFNYLELYAGYTKSNVGLFDFAHYGIMKSKEWGWIFINKLFKPFGFFSFIIFITIVENFIIYRFVKKNVPPKYYWLAVFVYAFNPYLMVIGASMMRQWLAICIFLLAFDYICKRKPIPYFLLITLAIQFHASAFIMYPLYFLTYYDRIKMTWSKMFLIVLCLAIWYLLSATLLKYMAPLLLSLDEWSSYEDMFQDAEGASFGFGVLGSMILTLASLSQIKYMKKNGVVATLDYSVVMLLAPMVMIVPMISRLNSYYLILSMIVFSLVTDILYKKNRVFAYMFLGMIILYLLRMWHGVFTSDIWSWSLQEYHTIFEVRWR